ncbi:hypothetical protein OAN22_00070 [Alphaproteobacteria bacterium]|nr:hypothetical protein [Alphaproteobacteria bacterium]
MMKKKLQFLAVSTILSLSTLQGCSGAAAAAPEPETTLTARVKENLGGIPAEIEKLFQEVLRQDARQSAGVGESVMSIAARGDRLAPPLIKALEKLGFTQHDLTRFPLTTEHEPIQWLETLFGTTPFSEGFQKKMMPTGDTSQSGTLALAYSHIQSPAPFLNLVPGLFMQQTYNFVRGLYEQNPTHSGSIAVVENYFLKMFEQSNACAAGALGRNFHAFYYAFNHLLEVKETAEHHAQERVKKAAEDLKITQVTLRDMDQAAGIKYTRIQTAQEIETCLRQHFDGRPLELNLALKMMALAQKINDQRKEQISEISLLHTLLKISPTEDDIGSIIKEFLGNFPQIDESQKSLLQTTLEAYAIQKSSVPLLRDETVRRQKLEAQFEADAKRFEELLGQAHQEVKQFEAYRKKGLALLEDYQKGEPLLLMTAQEAGTKTDLVLQLTPKDDCLSETSMNMVHIRTHIRVIISVIAEIFAKAQQAEKEKAEHEEKEKEARNNAHSNPNFHKYRLVALLMERERLGKAPESGAEGREKVAQLAINLFFERQPVPAEYAK